eukprot:NODE_8_length_47770_cov_0.334354.p8 type:complete len:374 gc:universal NODE_8_length_47770_cov_0.334354:45763-46884(+)
MNSLYCMSKSKDGFYNFINRASIFLLFSLLFLVAMVRLSHPSYMIKKESGSKNRIAMVLPYIGELPVYSRFFLDTIKDKSIDVYFVSVDNSTISSNYSNINQIELPVAFQSFVARQLCIAYECNESEHMELEKLADDKLHRKNTIAGLRPMLAYIFSEYLKDYEYVAWAQLETVWGDVDAILPYLNYDVVTVSTTDLKLLYLRAQFTALKNELRVTKSFTEAIPKALFFKMFKNDELLLSEEGIYSKYMFASDYSIAVVPFQANSWTCGAQKIIFHESKLICKQFISETTLEKIELNNKPNHIAQVSEHDCKSTWLAPEHRTCSNSLEYGFLVARNKLVNSYTLSESQKNSSLRFPVIYHFQKDTESFSMNFE